MRLIDYHVLHEYMLLGGGWRNRGTMIVLFPTRVRYLTEGSRPTTSTCQALCHIASHAFKTLLQRPLIGGKSCVKTPRIIKGQSNTPL